MKFEYYVSGLISNRESIETLDTGCLEFCRYERLLPLLYSSHTACSSEPAISTETYRATAAELAGKRVLEDTLAAFAREGIDTLLFKGTALAYLVYQYPWQRSRTDTDILVRPRDRGKVDSCLRSLGYVTENAIDGQLVVSERAYYFTDKLGLRHTLDVHWRLNNSWLLSPAAGFDELWAERIPVPPLSGQAVSLRHAVYIACVHRIAHMSDVAYELDDEVRYESDYLLWLYDIHLLSGRMSDADWRWLCVIARSRKMAVFVADGLSRTMDLFGTRLPEFVLDSLTGAESQHPLDPLRGRRLAHDLAAIKMLPGWKQRVVLLKEYLFPPKEYMVSKYGTDRLLPLYYAWRILKGTVRRVHSPGPDDA